MNSLLWNLCYGFLAVDLDFFLIYPVMVGREAEVGRERPEQ